MPNHQFGEGGAGTFSDGKLTTRVGDPLCAVCDRGPSPGRRPPTLRGDEAPQ